MYIYFIFIPIIGILLINNSILLQRYQTYQSIVNNHFKYKYVSYNIILKSSSENLPLQIDILSK